MYNITASYYILAAILTTTSGNMTMHITTSTYTNDSPRGRRVTLDTVTLFAPLIAIASASSVMK